MLGEDPVLQAVAAVEEHFQHDVPAFGDVNRDDVAHLGVVGNGADRALCESRTSTRTLALWGRSAPRQWRGLNALIGVSAKRWLSIGRTGPWAERL